MKFQREFNLALLTAILIAGSTPVLSTFAPKSINGTEVCAVGEPLALSPIEEGSNGSCVPNSVSCAFTCQQNAPNCTFFNYYAGECCQFFSGPIAEVTYM